MILMSKLVGQSQDDCFKDATKNGLVCFIADPYELFLDLDVPYGVPDHKVIQTLQYNGVLILGHGLVTVSKSGNSHIYYRINRALDYKEAAALQAALGSDPVKEALTILTRDFSALYETSLEAERVNVWRKQFEAKPDPFFDANDTTFGKQAAEVDLFGNTS